MKIILALLTVGCVAANSHWGWTPKKIYEFEYHGRLITGLPSIGSQYSGVGMRATVKVFAKEADTLILKVESPKYVNVNHVLKPKERGADKSYGDDGWNWRNLYLPDLSPVPQEQAAILEKPVQFKVAYNGEVGVVEVSKEEPEWSINFKKALIVLFQAKIDSYSWEIEENRIERPMAEARTSWKVKEESLQGRCENTYQVNELPEYIVRENPELIPLPEACPTNANGARKYFEITRTRNLDSCESRTQFRFFKPGNAAYSHGCIAGEGTNCGSMMSVTGFIVCASVAPSSSGVSGGSSGSSGSSGVSAISKALRAEKIVIQRITNDGEQNINMMPFNAERFVTGSRQRMMLKSIKDISAAPVVAQPIKLYDLMYEYNSKTLPRPLGGSGSGMNGGSGSGMGSGSGINGDLMAGRLVSGSNGANGLDSNLLSKVSPKSLLSGLGGSQAYPLPLPELKTKITKLLSEVTEEIVNSEKAGTSEEENKSNINMKLVSVVRGLSMLDKPQHFEELWTQLEQSCSTEPKKTVMKNYFIDTVGMVGTPPSIEYIIKLIEEDKMTPYQIAHYFTWMPHYVIYPTMPVLEKLLLLIKSEKLRTLTIVQNVAVTSFTKLVQQACISEERKTSYPVYVTGEFCSPDSRIVQEKLIPFLLSKLGSASNANERNLYLVALGALSHKNVISELIPYVDGSVMKTGVRPVTELNRLLATYSLGNVGYTRPNLVIPVLMTIFSNPIESTEMRIAAFHCILKLNAPATVFQRIATVTRLEPAMDYELLKTINIAMYSLGNQVLTEQMPPAKIALVTHARMALRMIRRVEGILPTSGTIYTSDFLPKLGIGYEGLLSWIASEASILPKSMYTEVMAVLDQFVVSPLRLGARLAGSENLYGKLGEALLKGLKGMGGSSSGAEEHSMGSEWTKIMKTLGGELEAGVKEGEMDAAFFLQIFDSAGIFLSKEGITTEMVSEKLLPYLKNPELLKQKIGAQMSVNVQRTFDLAQGALLVPSDMGFPINIEYHLPMTYSLIGSMTPVYQLPSPKLDISGKVILTSQYVAYVGTVVPFGKQVLLTGINEHTVVNIPGSLSLQLNVPNQKVLVSVKTHPNMNTKMDMLHFHMYPFTVSQSIADLTPICEQPTLKPISSGQKPKVLEAEFGEYLGLKMASKIKTESRFTDMASVMEILKMYKNPLNMMVFSWTSPVWPALSEKLTPSIRSHKYAITLDPTQSSTKELGLEIKIGCAIKRSGELEGKYHTVKVKESSGAGSSSGTNNGGWIELVEKLSPYGLAEKSVGVGTKVHARREEKLKEMMGGLAKSEGAAGITVIFNTIIKGSRPRTWTSILSLLGAASKDSYGSIKQKWDIRLERPSASSNVASKLCVQGTMRLPILPIWNIHELRTKSIDYVFENRIGMGMASCNESTIVTTGNAKVSEQQKEYSHKSPEAKLCEKLFSQNALGAESSQACKTANLQARTLDIVHISNRFTNVSPIVKVWEQRLVILMKAYLWPFAWGISSKNNIAPGTTFTTTARIEFQKWARAVNIEVKRPDEDLYFKNVHIPYPLTLFAPMKAGTNNLGLAMSKISPFTSPTMKCNVEYNSVRKYDNTTIPFKPDQCFHLLTAEAPHKLWAVEAAASSEPRKMDVKLIVKGTGKTGKFYTLLLKYSNGPKAWLDGVKSPVPLVPGEEAVIILDGGLDGEIVLDVFADRIMASVQSTTSHLISIVFNGARVEVLTPTTYKNKVVGVCGVSNLSIKGQANKGGYKKCTYSKASLEVASYRIESGSCPALKSSMKKELEKEKGQCMKREVVPTKLAKGYLASTGKCTVHKHIIALRPGQVCISKIPATFCGTMCKAEQGQKVEKSVEFVCLPEGRLAEYYKHKAQAGENLVNELRSMDASFATKMSQPRHCVPSGPVSNQAGSVYRSGSSGGYGSGSNL
jgi:hypothetical protein